MKKELFLLNYNQILTRVFLPFLIIIFFTPSISAQSLQLYTPYRKITVPPGESIDYSIEVINNGSSISTAEVRVTGLPDSWTYTLRSGGWDLQDISVLPGEKKSMNLKVNVPYEIDKGTYTFRVLAVNNSVLPLTINVSEHGTLKTEFTSEQANMQGHAKSDFNFRTKLNNQTGETQRDALTSNAPRGWSVVFKPNYQQATSVEIEPGQNKDITVEVKPPFGIKAGKYTIPIMARTNATSANLDLEVDITGTFEMELSTPSGLLSSSITAGRKKRIDLVVRNTGSTDMTSIRMSSSKPRGWEVTFSNDTIPFIAAGETAGLTAQIKAYEKSIPGDYVISLTAQTPETSSAASFRIAVKTSPLWGWLGIFIILSTIWVIFYLFRKYGRR